MTPLPTPVKVVRVAETFSPSLLAVASRCPLRAVLAASKGEYKRLPTSPAAERGIVFHQLLERVGMGSIPVSGDPWHALEEELERLLTDAQARLAARPDTRHFADLRRTLPQVAWHNASQDVLSAARGLLGLRSSPRPQGNYAGGQRPEYLDLTGPGSWTEVRVVAPSLRIVGRVDVVEREDASHVVVYDYKTGRVMDRDGSVLDHISLQLQLYALAIQSLNPGVKVRLVVSHGGQEIPVPADEVTLEATREWLRGILAVLPAGQDADAEQIARPGPDCKTCPFRHVCSAYQAAAPQSWKSCPEEAAWPLDTWGQVLAVETRGSTYTVDLRDAADRRVRVLRLDGRHENLRATRKGDPIWFFGLCATRSLVTRGVRVHPLNLYELPSETTQPRAWSLAIYGGSA